MKSRIIVIEVNVSIILGAEISVEDWGRGRGVLEEIVFRTSQRNFSLRKTITNFHASWNTIELWLFANKLFYDPRSDGTIFCLLDNFYYL